MSRAIVRLFQRYRTPVLLTLSGFVVPLITNLASSWLESAYGQTSSQLIQLIAIIVAFSVVLFGMTVITRLAPRGWSIIPKNLKPAPKKGLILIVGPGRSDSLQDFQSNAAYIAIDYHCKGGLKFVWAITTEKGIPVTNHLAEEFKGIQITPVPVYNSLSITETYQAVQKIYQELIPQAGINPDEVIADFTGGTRPMSVGLALACANLLPMQFIAGTPGNESVPLQTDFQPAAQTEGRSEEG